MNATALGTLGFDIASLHAAYRSGTSPADVLREASRRIAGSGDPGIFIDLVAADDLVAEAESLGDFDAARTLWGVPYVVKDNIDVAGRTTTAGCAAYAYQAREDSAVVAALRAAGAIVVGKANLDQFATGLVGTRSPWPVPRNPIDERLIPGGSSSGSAVSVARGLASFSLGTDTAGSGRVPAAHNNLVGLKPTPGRISARGTVPACRTIDTVSVFAGNVDDAHRVLQVLSAFDPEDPYSRPMPAPVTPMWAPRSRIGVPGRAARLASDEPEQVESFDAACALLVSLGHELVELDLAPLHDIAELLYAGCWVAERHGVVAELLETDPDALHPITRRIVQGAIGRSATDAFRDFYRVAELERDSERLLADIDALCVPTVPFLCTREQDASDPVGANTRLGHYTNFANLLRMAAVAVPVAPRADGLPGNVTLLTGEAADGAAIALARDLQRVANASPGATGHTLPAATGTVDPLAAHELAIAVVGAHMSGLPLNPELTGRSGRRLRATRTTPDYRLYALPDGPPARPGLVRAAPDDEGAAIELEVWALPRERVGDLLAGIPAPLGLGTLELEDGSTVHGFLCEAAAVADATDITASGGWRAWLATRPG